MKRNIHTKRTEVPALAKGARLLLHTCLGAVCLYLLCVAVYAGSGSPLYVREMLESAHIAAVIAVGGALAFDLELRYAKKNRR